MVISRNYRTICSQWGVGYTGFPMFMSFFGVLKHHRWFAPPVFVMFGGFKGTYSKPSYTPWALTTKAPQKWWHIFSLALAVSFRQYTFQERYQVTGWKSPWVQLVFQVGRVSIVWNLHVGQNVIQQPVIWRESDEQRSLEDARLTCIWQGADIKISKDAVNKTKREI